MANFNKGYTDNPRPGPYAQQPTLGQFLIGLPTPRFKTEKELMKDLGIQNPYVMPDKDINALLAAVESKPPVMSDSPSEKAAPVSKMGPLAAVSVGHSLPGPGPFRLNEGSYKMPWEEPQKPLTVRTQSSQPQGSLKPEPSTEEGSSDGSLLTLLNQLNTPEGEAPKLPERSLRNMDLRSVANLVDSWTGSRLSAGYEDPLEKEQARQKEIAALAYTKNKERTERVKTALDAIDKFNDNKRQARKDESEIALNAAKAFNERRAGLSKGEKKEKDLSEEKYVELENEFGKKFNGDLQKIYQAQKKVDENFDQSIESINTGLFNQARRFSKKEGIPLSEAYQIALGVQKEKVAAAVKAKEGQ